MTGVILVVRFSILSFVFVVSDIFSG